MSRARDALAGRADATIAGAVTSIDDWLARQARQGDAEAYGELTDRHRRAALRVATVVLGAADGADDVVQLALERAWRSIEQFDPGRAFRPWLLRIVANTARNDRRSRGRRARLAVRVGRAADRGEETSAEDVVVSDLERGQVLDALNRLRGADRLVIALRHFEGLSTQEMAVVLGCPSGTVKSRLSRAMTRLRTQLERNGETGEIGEATGR